MKVKLNEINPEQFFGIIPIDEELYIPEKNIIDLISETNDEIENVQTRKPDEFYEDIKEKENNFKYPDES